MRVIEQSYRPGTGTSVGTGLVSPEFRASAEGRRFIARYCADQSFLAAVDRMARVQLRRLSPTQFEMVRSNWRPTQDLNIIVLQPRLPEQ